MSSKIDELEDRPQKLLFQVYASRSKLASVNWRAELEKPHSSQANSNSNFGDWTAVIIGCGIGNKGRFARNQGGPILVQLKQFGHLLALTVSLSVFATGNVLASNELTLVDDSQGCFHHHNEAMIYDLAGDKLTAQGTGKELSSDELVDLIRIINSSERYAKLDISILGVTPETVAKNRARMIEASRPFGRIFPKEIIKDNISLFEFPSVSKSLEQWMSFDRHSTTHVSFHAWINSKQLNAENIEVSSTTERPGMLPWKVKVGKRTWNTYSIALPEQLAKFANVDGPCFRLINCSSYWGDEFWKDHEYWNETVGGMLSTDYDKRIAKSLPGFEKASKLFKIERCILGCVSPQPESLYMWLKTEPTETIRSVCWYNLLKEPNKPNSDWNQMLIKYNRCTELAKQQKWLADWLAASPNHEIGIDIAGNNCYEVSNKDILQDVMPVWHDLELPGRPFVELTLSNESETCGKVWLSSQDSAPALVVQAKPGKGSHWFDKQELWFNPTQPRCLVVTADGQFKDHQLSKEYLAPWQKESDRFANEIKREGLRMTEKWNKALAKKKKESSRLRRAN